jgi:hypothetical protein
MGTLQIHLERSTMFNIDLDTPVHGAAAIAEVLNLRDADGKPDERRAYYALEKGYVDASKMGTTWWSTRRRLLAPHLKHVV